MNEFLRDSQMKAVNKMRNGCILNGGVGSGKSRTGLYYYFKENGGSFINQEYVPMKNPQDLYIVTTAMKRDRREWDGELANYRLSPKPKKINCTVIKSLWTLGTISKNTLTYLTRSSFLTRIVSAETELG